MRRLTRAREIWRDRRGATVVEFAIIAPVLMLATIGIIELALAIFIAATIESAVFEASRFGITGPKLEAGASEERIRELKAEREARVLEIVARRTLGIMDMDEMDIETLIYSSFEEIGRPEPYDDTNGNGRYDQGEPFTDVNKTGKWETDMGEAGLGGPGDVVVYRLTYSWGVITPIMREVMGDQLETVSSVAVRNEPM